MRQVLIIFVICTLVISGGTFYFWKQLINSRPTSKKLTSDFYTYEVQPGKSAHSVAIELYNLGYIQNPLVFRILARVENKPIKVGEYNLRSDMTLGEVYNMLSSGMSVQRSIMVKEGQNLFEIAEEFERLHLASKKEFFELTHSEEFISQLMDDPPKSLEGYLFPETYSYTKYMKAKDVLEAMVKQFLTVSMSLQYDPSKFQWNRHQWVTFASLIEKETGVPEERALISSVFHNRLKKGMMLQTDPSTLYAKSLSSGHLEMNITKSDLTLGHPYNTYVNKGLPPGPIANPGKEALWAAIHPVSSEYLFFVSKNNGTHMFSKSLEEHEKNVEHFQKDPKARQGKSWRDYLKK